MDFVQLKQEQSLRLFITNHIIDDVYETYNSFTLN